MHDVKSLFKENYLTYASYVILDRAIPHLVDGLKPVQRRILWTLLQMEDGKLHKVANVAGQTMAYHPHGDAAIIEALVNLANRGFLLQTQGNFGNPITGDPAAAARYIETRLSALALETLFSHKLTQFVPSYDGRKQEPVTLPVKLPLLLMQGAEGIAVGMATKIFPHNFKELLLAQIALLEGKKIKVLPDFPSGGDMDASDYQEGKGSIRVRARIEIADPKTLIIKEICPHTTTESLIRSIDEAVKKGKLKIESIYDYSAEQVSIEIKIGRQKASQVLEQLFAFTDCQVELHPQMVVIDDNKPIQTTVTHILQRHVDLVVSYLYQESELEKKEIQQHIFMKKLEQLFIEKKLYQKIEPLRQLEEMLETLSTSLKPFEKILGDLPSKAQIEKLLQIPIRKISLFDIEKNKQDILALSKRIQELDQKLKHPKETTITYLKQILKTYGELFPRKTKIRTLTKIDKVKLSTKTLSVGYDIQTGYYGSSVSSLESVTCSNQDALICLFENGACLTTMAVDKERGLQGVGLLFFGVLDSSKAFTIVYEGEDQKTYVKRFIVRATKKQKILFFLQEKEKYICMTHESNRFKLPGRKNIWIDPQVVPLRKIDSKGTLLKKLV